MLRRWVQMLGGNSYWHVEQGVGRCYQPGVIHGYYNDLTGKVAWHGLQDELGLPVNRSVDGTQVHVPTVLFQKALGHWDSALLNEDGAQEHRSAFFRLADWAVGHQDSKGGWPIWPLAGLTYPSPYSAMTQGEGISVLVRAFRLAEDVQYLRAARKAVVPMTTPLALGGTARESPDGLILEEVPSHSERSILNGWIFALFGLHDLRVTNEAPETDAIVRSALRGLVRQLALYDSGFWSYYDQSGHLASPFYHSLHIAQLRAVEMTFPDFAPEISLVRQRFEAYGSRWFNRAVALTVKTAQKLKNPPEAMFQ